MHKRNLLIAYRMLFALLAVGAVVTEVAVLAERGLLVPANFFSFFTIQSNIFAAVVFILSSLALVRGRESKGLALLRGAATLYLAITGVVFSLLLAGSHAQLTAVAWDNTVLHQILPVAVVLDWFIALPKVRIAFKSALIWLIYPLLYLAYSLIRGYFVHWYPYPFLDPGEQGYAGVALTCVAISAGAVAAAWLLTRFTKGTHKGT